MNLLAMALMMGIAMIFMHGQGHHPSAPRANHRSEKLAIAPSDMPDAPQSTQTHGESGCSSSPDHKKAQEPNPQVATQKSE